MAGLDLDNVIFLDESGCNIQFARQHGWALRGESVCDYIPSHRGPNITVVGAIRRDRLLCYDVLRGALNKDNWRVFVRNKLAPRLYPEDILVLDNLQVHKDPVALEWIEATGATVLFQPPYSPDLNAIELCWAFMKRHLRKFRERVVSKMAHAIRRALARVTTAHLESWFAHCCYPQPD